MKNLMIWGLLLISCLGHTSTLDSFFESEQAYDLCLKAKSPRGLVFLKKIVTSEDQVLFAYSNRSRSLVSINNQENQEAGRIEVNSAIKDIKVDEKQIYILTRKDLHIYDRFTFSQKHIVRTLSHDQPYTQHTFGNELFIGEKKIYIAHGEIGLVRIDKETYTYNSIIKPKLPQSNVKQRSTLTGVVKSGNFLYLAYDNITFDFTEKIRAFEGLVVLNAKSLKLVNTISINQKREAYHRPSLSIQGNKLYVNNLHLYFEHSLKKLLNTKSKLNPSKRIYNYSAGYLVASGILSENKVYGCYEDKRTFKLKAGISSF